MPVEIELTRGYKTLVDECDLELVMRQKWRVSALGRGQLYALGWVRGGNGGRSIRLHRLIMNAREDEMVDHKDGNGLNNTRANLRLCTNSQNQANSRCPHNKSVASKGVYFQHNRYRATIRVNGKPIWLGGYKTEKEAHEAYCAAAIKYFGEFARSA